MLANRLAGETSPYLLQHAHNPVDWYPWGRKAFDRARAEDRPIFLSVGYAACHWCHVMERESFEDPATAALLNDGFVAIKVDREERPDVDGIYMAAVQAMTGSGGWPMSVFLTPEGRPFYGGTYFPDESRHGLPAFRDLLAAVLRAWSERRDELEGAARRLSDAIGRAPTSVVPGSLPGMPDAPGTEAAVVGSARTTGAPGASGPATAALLDRATRSLVESFDGENGGWGWAPKFPQPMAIGFLLRRAAAGDFSALRVARTALDRMAAGGIHDQLGGGFHRYSTDARWLVPHFEKMLYDNAQLVRVYLQGYQLTGHERYRQVAERTLDYLRREMLTTDGLLAASQDADTGGVEGATYTWTLEEIEIALGPKLAPLAATAWGVTRDGNWEGRTVLSVVHDSAAVALIHAISEAEAEAGLAEARTALLALRERRAQPARDDKALAAWNGLTLGAFADAARILGRDGDREAAVQIAEGLIGCLRGPDGRLYRSWKDGRATLNGYLEDQACAADGLLALYEATFDERWFVAVGELTDVVMTRFPDPTGGFFDTSDDHEPLLYRPKQLEDNALPSGNAMMAGVLLRLAALTGEGRHRSAAERALGLVADTAGQYPLAYAQWLAAVDFASADVHEIAIVGDPAGSDTGDLLSVARAGFRPHQVVALSARPGSSAVPLMEARTAVNGRATAYVCRGFACRQPVTDPADLAALLGGASWPAIAERPPGDTDAEDSP